MVDGVPKVTWLPDLGAERVYRVLGAKGLGDAAGETLRGTVFTFRAGDRFGEQGLVCYVIVDRTAKRITDFVMSCRAMGRTLEHFALAYVEKALGYRPEIDFVPTAKNKPFADFLAGLDGSPLKTHFKERI